MHRSMPFFLFPALSQGMPSYPAGPSLECKIRCAAPAWYQIGCFIRGALPTPKAENSDRWANELAKPYRGWHSSRPAKATVREFEDLIERQISTRRRNDDCGDNQQIRALVYLSLANLHLYATAILAPWPAMSCSRVRGGGPRQSLLCCTWPGKLVGLTRVRFASNRNSIRHDLKIKAETELLSCLRAETLR